MNLEAASVTETKEPRLDQFIREEKETADQQDNVYRVEMESGIRKVIFNH